MDYHSTPPSRIALMQAIRKSNEGNTGKRQCARLLEAMERLEGGVTTAEASRFLDVYDPPARKRDLLARGVKIVLTWDVSLTESGVPHRVGRYSLVRGKA